jgi:peptide/nickel transport system permease protein
VTGRWLVGKVLAAILTLLFVIVFNFFLFRVMGDPTSQLARLPQSTPQEIKQLQKDYGLDKPLIGQFADYVGDTARLDLGISQGSRRPVWDEIKDALPWTLLLVGTGTLLATILGSWMGVAAATRRGKKADDGLLGFSLFTYAAPEYWIGIILILVFAVWIPVFPDGLQMTPGADFSSFFDKAVDVLDHMILPVTAMTLMLLGQYFLIMRSSMVDVLTEDFVTVKRATGLPWHRVVRSHAVPNALLPTLTLVFYSFGFILGGSVIVEAVYSWPGLGLLTYRAIQDLDYNVIQAVFLLFSLAVIAFNLAADIMYGYLDPRVREA